MWMLRVYDWCLASDYSSLLENCSTIKLGWSVSVMQPSISRKPDPVLPQNASTLAIWEYWTHIREHRTFKMMNLPSKHTHHFFVFVLLKVFFEGEKYKLKNPILGRVASWKEL